MVFQKLTCHFGKLICFVLHVKGWGGIYVVTANGKYYSQSMTFLISVNSYPSTSKFCQWEEKNDFTMEIVGMTVKTQNKTKKL
jgi:hypothetical protein